MLLISILGGKFKIFGAEVSAVAGPTGRIVAGVAGAILVGIGLYSSLYMSGATQAEGSAGLSVELSPQASIKPVPAPVPELESVEALPETFVLGKLTCIRPQEERGEDRVYLRVGNSKPTRIWELKAGESVRVKLAAAAGSSVSLYEKDGFFKDKEDDDLLGTAKLLGRGGKLRFEIPETGEHLYTLNYEPDS